MDEYTSDISEQEYQDWVQSITLVQDDGTPSDMELEEDTSPDPENDRGEGES